MGPGRPKGGGKWPPWPLSGSDTEMIWPKILPKNDQKPSFIVRKPLTVDSSMTLEPCIRRRENTLLISIYYERTMSWREKGVLKIDDTV